MTSWLPDHGAAPFSPARPKLLVLSFFPAFDPPRSGGELRLLNLYRALSRHCDIMLLSSTDSGARREVVQHALGLREIRFPKDEHWRAAYATLERSGLSGDLAGLAFALAVGEPDCALRVEALRLAEEADLVVHEFPYSAPIFDDAPPRAEIYNSHNFELGLLPAIATGPGIARAFERLRLLEGGLARRCRLVLATSERDAELFRLMYGVPRERLGLCPNGFDAAELAPVLAERRRSRPAATAGGRPRLLFTGSAHGPNVEAARFLLRIALALPEMDFVLAGGVCGPVAEAAGIPPNVTLAGPFDEQRKRALYVEADIYVNPVVEGSGTNLKTVEALAAGLPLVATPEGVRGLPVRSGQEAILAERSGFIEAIRAAAEAPPEALAHMAEAGEALVRTGLDWTAITDALLARIVPLVAGGGAGTEDLSQSDRPLVLAFNDYPVDSATFGGARRIREVLGHLGMDVALLCLGGRPGVSLVAPGFLHVTLPKDERHREVERAVNAAFPAVSATDVVSGLFCAANRPLVALAADLGRRCSAVVFEHCYMAPMLDAAFPEGGGNAAPPVIYSAHNVEAPLKARLLQGHPLRAELVDFTARIEAALTRRADLVVACSAGDVAHFATVGARTLLVPNGCDPDRTGGAGPTEAAERDGKQRVGFMGSAHPPNVEAARFILDALAPALPDVRFEFLGGVCGALGRPATENVALHWTVDEAAKSRLLRSWDVALNPLYTGGGSSLKVPDYMAHGLATLSTPEGARGFAVAEAGLGLVVPHEGFAEALRTLLADTPARRALAERAARHAREHLAWPAACRPYAEALRGLIRETAAAGAERQGRRRRLLVVTYRYTEPALGGAEEYLVEIVSRLRPHFARIDLAAIGLTELTNHLHFACRFTADAGGATRVLGELFDRIAFFPPDAVPEAELTERCRRLELAWVQEGSALLRPFLDRLPEAGEPVLMDGFHHPEIRDGVARRWTAGRFTLLLPPHSRVIELAGWVPRAKLLTLRASPLPGTAAAAPAASGQPVHVAVDRHFAFSLALPPGGNAPILLSGEVEAEAPEGDPRPLGVLVEHLAAQCEAVEDGSALAGGGDAGGLTALVQAKADLAEDLEALLRTRFPERWQAALQDLALARGAEAEADFAAARGPHSAALQDWLRRHAGGYDTVLVQGIPFDVAPRTAETLTALPEPRPRLVLLPHFHGDDRFYYWRRYLEAFARADRTLLFSQGLAERLGPRGRFAVVPGGGVAGTELALPAAFARFREARPDLEEPFFLVLGRKTGSKGYQRVVRAVQALRAAGEAVSVVLIGPDEDRVALGGLAGVHYLGRQPRETVLGALALCRGLVSMSVSESFGIVLCEAWKFRKPVVANRACASFRELVEDGVSGLLAETDTELLAAMRRLLDEPGLAERLGAAGFAAVTRRYSWEMAARAVARELTGAAETGRW